jgi:lysophospholipase
LELIEGAEHEVLMETPEIRKSIYDSTVAHFDAHLG